jgi:hypothetical protein
MGAGLAFDAFEELGRHDGLTLRTLGTGAHFTVPAAATIQSK